MFVIGILNDEKMAADIIREYSSREIKGYFYFSAEHNANVIAVEDEELVAIALDIYRVKLGLKKAIPIDPEWIKIKSVPKGQWTKCLAIFSLIIYLFSFFDLGKNLYQFFLIDTHDHGFLLDITHGQIWRLITPIFLHMGFLHILFNMLWFLDLGSIFEYKFKASKFFLFIFISGVFSNLLQYFFVGKSFGGMSGVLYAFLAYLWLAKRLDDKFEFSLPKQDSYLMIGWFFLCLVGILPHIANFAHAGGIAIGLWWAVFANFKFDFDRIKYIGIGFFIVFVTILVEKYHLHFNF